MRICCCITVHGYQELLETNVYAIALSAAIAIISRPQLEKNFKKKKIPQRPRSVAREFIPWTFEPARVPTHKLAGSVSNQCL